MRIARLSLVLVAGLSFGYLLSFPLAIGRADESHLLLPAKRILEGDVLYRDLAETLTPLSYYLVAAIYAVAGTSLVAVRVVFAAIDALGAALLFRLVRRVAGAPEAMLATLVFVGLCLPAWPFASPHWLSTTLALLAATLLVGGGPRRGSAARALAVGVVVGVAICVQQQRGVFLAAWVALAWIAWFADRRLRGWRPGAVRVAWSAAAAGLVTAVVLGHAAARASVPALVDGLYGFAVRYYAPAQAGRTPWAGVLPLTEPWARSTVVPLLRVAPLLVLAEAARLVWRRRRGWEAEDRERAVLALLAVLMGASVWYLPDFIHVSFVLPFLLVPGASLVYAMRTGGPAAPRRAGAAVVWALCVAVAARAAANPRYAWALAPVRIATAIGPLDVDPKVAALYETVRAHLVREPDGRAVLYSFPDDAWLYLALDADDPTRFSVLVSGFFPEVFLDEAVDAIRARRPGTVVLALPFTPDRIRRAVEDGYVAVADTWVYRVYARRGPSTSQR